MIGCLYWAATFWTEPARFTLPASTPHCNSLFQIIIWNGWNTISIFSGYGNGTILCQAVGGDGSFEAVFSAVRGRYHLMSVDLTQDVSSILEQRQALGWIILRWNLAQVIVIIQFLYGRNHLVSFGEQGGEFQVLIANRGWVPLQEWPTDKDHYRDQKGED